MKSGQEIQQGSSGKEKNNYGKNSSAVHISNNVCIGANAVVTHDVSDNACVAGVPVQIISMDGAEGYVNNRV